MLFVMTKQNNSLCCMFTASLLISPAVSGVGSGRINLQGLNTCLQEKFHHCEHNGSFSGHRSIVAAWSGSWGRAVLPAAPPPPTSASSRWYLHHGDALLLHYYVVFLAVSLSVGWSTTLVQRKICQIFMKPRELSLMTLVILQLLKVLNENIFSSVGWIWSKDILGSQRIKTYSSIFLELKLQVDNCWMDCQVMWSIHMYMRLTFNSWELNFSSGSIIVSKSESSQHFGWCNNKDITTQSAAKAKNQR